MEDQFANILQRNYGLKAVGKSASYGPRSDDRASGRALDRGKSVGSGLGRINQSAAAALFAAGEVSDVFSHGHNGLSKSSSRLSDAPSTYGSAHNESFRGSTKSTSVGGFEEIFSGGKSGSASSSVFADYFEGSFGKSTARSSGSPSSEDIPAVFPQTRSRRTDQPIESVNEQEPSKEWAGRRSSRSGDSRRSAEEEFRDSLTREIKVTSQAGSAPSSYDSAKSQTPKSFRTGEPDSPLKGSFMRGFGRSRTARSAPQQFSPKAEDSVFELSPGEGVSVLTGSRLNAESIRKTTSAASSISYDGSEADSLGRVDANSGFTVPASIDSAFPDLNEPYASSRMDLPTKRLRQLKVSSSEPDSESGVMDSLDRFPKTPRTPSSGTSKPKASPNSGSGPSESESRSHVLSEGVRNDEGVPLRKAHSVDSPTPSPSRVHRPRKSSRTDIRSHVSSPSIDEPLTKFEVNLPTVGGSADSQRARRKSDPLGQVWYTVDQIRLVTKPSTHPPPSRPPPPLPSLTGQHSGTARHRSSSQNSQSSETPRPQSSQNSQSSETPKPQSGQKSQSSETFKPRSSQKSQSSEIDKPHSSPKSQSSGTDRHHPSEKEQQRADVERQHSGAKQQASGNVRGNGSVETKSEEQKDQKAGYVLPEVTVVDLGPEMKPSREERRRMRDQIERERRRAKREEERLKEKERLEREGSREALFRDIELRYPSRPREGRREKVFEPRAHQSQETATKREEKDILYPRREEKEIQYRVIRQQEKEFQERLARQEEARERENERSGERLRRSVEKAALEAQERAERAAVERAVQEAHERAERAARQRAAAAREKERVKEKERERERERDREEEKLRDRLREKERGLAEQLRSRDTFRATSEPRQRPSVSVNVNTPTGGGLSRFSSGGSLSNMSGTPDSHLARRSSTTAKVDDWTNIFTQPAANSGPDKFQEIPGEPADRRKLRLEKQTLIEERAAKALQEKNMRDQALLREQEERQRFASTLDADVRRWSAGKEGNLRALLSSLHLMLWPECNWKILSISDLVSGPSVKKAYQRAILCVHPDKVQQKGANVKQKYVAEKVFDLLKEAYAKFNSELN